MNTGLNFQATISGRLLHWLGIATVTAVFSASAMAQITGTKHNLSSGGSGNNKFSGTDQICVFCHTPHAADNTQVVPLWNRTMSAPAGGYTTYDTLGTPTLDGKTLGVGSISLACLSCHDGTQAMNSVINAPGSGLAGSAAWQAGSWTGNSTPTGAALIGTDLSNDHPIGIEYCGGGIVGNGTNGFSSSTCRDSDFVGTTQITTSDARLAQVQTATIGGAQAFWVNLGAGTTRDKGDISLYNRNFTSVGGSANTPSVECGSCHEPHTAATGIGNVAFMRVTAAGSAICLSCHVK